MSFLISFSKLKFSLSLNKKLSSIAYVQDVTNCEKYKRSNAVCLLFGGKLIVALCVIPSFVKVEADTG
jgi:hypothetical protein